MSDTFIPIIKNKIQFSEYFTSEILSDVKFVFDGAKEIPAHRFILATNSSVFRQMFFGNLKETGDIKIIDVSPEAFTEFLQFFYLEKVNLSGDNIEQIMYLADKYDVTQCKAVHGAVLKNSLFPDNFLWIYEMARKYNHDDLKAYCEERMQIDPKSIFDTPSFKQCGYNQLMRVLSVNLNCDELTVFNACMDWAKNKCKRENIVGNTGNYKKVLGDCFHLIRFPAMTNKEFCSVLQDHADFFDKDMLADIYTHITLARPLKVATQFISDRRQNDLTLIRYRKDSSTCNHTIQQKEVMTFSTEQRIVLNGIIINESIHSLILLELFGNMKIFNLNTSTDELLLDQPVQFSNLKSNYYNFLKPIVINPQQKHEIQIIFDTILEGQTFSVTVLEYDPIVELKEGIQFQFLSKDSENYDSVRFGLISGLNFWPM